MLLYTDKTKPRFYIGGVFLVYKYICEGCRMEGTKTVFCENMCEIRKCALKKGFSICGDCSELKTCSIVGAIISNNPEALENLK